MLYGWQVVEVVGLKNDWSTGQSYRPMDSLSGSLRHQSVSLVNWSLVSGVVEVVGFCLVGFGSTWLNSVRIAPWGDLTVQQNLPVPLAKLASSFGLFATKLPKI